MAPLYFQKRNTGMWALTSKRTALLLVWWMWKRRWCFSKQSSAASLLRRSAPAQLSRLPVPLWEARDLFARFFQCNTGDLVHRRSHLSLETTQVASCYGHVCCPSSTQVCQWKEEGKWLLVRASIPVLYSDFHIWMTVRLLTTLQVFKEIGSCRVV